MTTFDERERAYEAHFALDQELEFKAQSRRDRMLGHWAGDLLGLTGAALDAYVTSVIKAEFEEPGDDDVFRKVLADFAEKKVDVQPQQLRQQMDTLMAKARADIMSGT